MLTAFRSLRALGAGIGLTAALVGPIAYVTGRTHGANAIRAELAREVQAALQAEDALAQTRAQITGQWAMAGYQIGLTRAAQTDAEPERQTRMEEIAHETASDPLREPWPVSDQRRVKCLLDPDCDPASLVDR